MEITRLFDLLPYYKATYPPKDDVLAGKEDGKWVKHNIDDYIATANKVSYALMKLGVKPGDKVATITNNRPEWNFLDMGISQCGAVHVPIYPTISEADYKYILAHANVGYIFVSGQELLKRIMTVAPQVESVKEVISIDGFPGVRSFKDFTAYGSENTDSEGLEDIKGTIKGSDLVTLIYTSGTTGNPKGVMLTHNNLLSQVFAVAPIPPCDHTCRALSYLPLCHVYERILTYVYQFLGISVYYAENIGKIADNMREVQPQIFSTVPRLLEKIYDRIISKGRKLKGLKRAIFFWAVNIGLKYELNGANGWWYELQLKIVDKLVFVKWREALGGKFRVVVSGGSALQPRLARTFWAAGIPVLEGYGLTETSPVISVNTFFENGCKFGTVGTVLDGVTVKIAEDGEVLCKGPNVMMGYYKDDEMTREVIDKEGWFHTGDVGVLDGGVHLRLTGRKKEIFKTSMGKYIAPQIIENKLKESSFIDNAMVVGEYQKFAAALIVPDFAHLRSYCEIKGIEFKSESDIIRNDVIRKRIFQEVVKTNKTLGDFEEIKKIELIDHEWGIDSGELTPTLKIKRDVVGTRYKELIDNMFA
jgi:long-chain acyl-CoA synthetase